MVIPCYTLICNNLPYHTIIDHILLCYTRAEYNM